MKGSRNEKLSGIIICYTWPEIFIFILVLCFIISTTTLYEMYIKQIKKVASLLLWNGRLKRVRWRTIKIEQHSL